jgi:hypothetical protein
MVAPNAFEQKVRAHRSCEDAIPGDPSISASKQSKFYDLVF